MAKLNLRKILALALVLLLCLSQLTQPVSAKGGGKPESGSDSSGYEWYKVVVQGVQVASGTGPKGDIGWLVWGVYSWDVSISGSTLSWRAGNQSGTVDLSSVITIPEGFEVKEYTAASTSVTGTNTQKDKYDNATITVTINTLYNEKTEEVIVVPTDPEPTDPEPTDPEPTDPEPTDPEPTDPEPTDPEPTEPEPTEPEPTDPEPTDPEPTEPEPTDPEPTDPEPTDPEPTEPEEGGEPSAHTDDGDPIPEPTDPEGGEPAAQSDEGDPIPEPTDPPATEPPAEAHEPAPQSDEGEPAPQDAETPLADVPRTGDPILLYALVSAASLGGSLILSRKRKEE